MSERCVDECKGCLKTDCGGRTCSVFEDPKYQHQHGKCFGFTDDPEDMAKLFDDLALNADSPVMARKYTQEARAWRQRIGQLPPGEEPVMKRRGRPE